MPRRPSTATDGGIGILGTTGSGSRRRYLQLAVGLAVTDFVAVDAALIASRLILHGRDQVHAAFSLSLVLGPLGAIVLFSAFGLYRLSHLTPVDEFRRVIEATVVGVSLRVLGGAIFAAGTAGAASQSWLALTTVFLLVAVLATRLVWHQYMAHLRTKGKLAVRALIIGTNEEAAQVADALHRRATGFLPVGLIQTDGQWWPGHSLPILGSLVDVSEIVEAAGIEAVFIASSAVRTEEMQGMLRRLRRSHLDVRVSANITEILASRLSVQPVGSLLALSLPPVGLTGMKAVLKRTFDLVGATLLVLVLAPVWIVVPILVWATTRGPVFFRQTRIGKDAKAFTIHKFRTMVRDADKMAVDLAPRNEGSGPLFVLKNDPRVTRIGRFLRKLSLDELPQLINVLKGDMSLVGPRPPLPSEVALYEDWHLDRLQVRPGLTGLWQVGGRQRVGRRNELSFDDHVRLDLFYIENWSLAYDLFILMKTFPAILSQAARGEYG